MDYNIKTELDTYEDYLTELDKVKNFYKHVRSSNIEPEKKDMILDKRDIVFWFEKIRGDTPTSVDTLIIVSYNENLGEYEFRNGAFKGLFITKEEDFKNRYEKHKEGSED